MLRWCLFWQDWTAAPQADKPGQSRPLPQGYAAATRTVRIGAQAGPNGSEDVVGVIHRSLQAAIDHPAESR